MVSTTDNIVVPGVLPLPVSVLIVRPKPSIVLRDQWELVLLLLTTALMTGGNCVSLYVMAVCAPDGESVEDGRALESYPMEADSPLGPVAEVGARKPV